LKVYIAAGEFQRIYLRYVKLIFVQLFRRKKVVLKIIYFGWKRWEWVGDMHEYMQVGFHSLSLHVKKLLWSCTSLATQLCDHWLKTDTSEITNAFAGHR